MKNISKTILFAILIATMILPFSSMDISGASAERPAYLDEQKSYPTDVQTDQFDNVQQKIAAAHKYITTLQNKISQFKQEKSQIQDELYDNPPDGKIRYLQRDLATVEEKLDQSNMHLDSFNSKLSALYEITRSEEKITQREALLEQNKDKLKKELDPTKIFQIAKRISNLENQIEASYQKLVDASKSSQTISGNKIIKRIDQTWQSYYSSLEEFQKFQSEIDAYVNADLPNNGWNKKMVGEQVKQYNFESIIGKKGHGHELVSLFVAKQKINGKYDESGPIAKYHEWAAKTHPSPDTKQKINKRISDIVGGDDLVIFAKKMVESLNVMAQHGNVPSKVSESDPHYWMVIISAAICMYEPDCDSDALYANAKLPPSTPEQLQALRGFEKNQGIDPITGKSMECAFLLPCVDVAAQRWEKINVEHAVSAVVNAYTCGSDTCIFAAYTSGTGELTLDVIPWGLHRYSKPGLDVQAFSYSYDSDTIHSLKGKIQIGNGKAFISAVGAGMASFDEYLTTNQECGGGTPRQCGVMIYTVTSNAVKWINQ